MSSMRGWQRPTRVAIGLFIIVFGATVFFAVRERAPVEDLSMNEQLDPEKAASILRDKKGVKDTALGFGNELAINQLLAHHGIIFQPEERKVWVSSSPYQLGAFVAYDLDEVFKEFENGDHSLKGIDSLLIKKDPFFASKFL